MHSAVAVDLGATSARFAAGWFIEDHIDFEIIEQIPHHPIRSGHHQVWDIDLLVAICQRASRYASECFKNPSIGIDTWGVDIGFLDAKGDLLRPIVAYRDESHSHASELLDSVHLYSLTGIQRQPFNTIYQLYARGIENPGLKQRRWLLLPDLLGYLLCGKLVCEQTIASTTGLMGLDGHWCKEAFERIGWPVPVIQPSATGTVSGPDPNGVSVIRVGGHDTASAVYGMGLEYADQAFLNVGTWSLLGCVVNEPIVTAEAEEANFTNERANDGRIRFLVNIPGFYIVNRIHEELGIQVSVPLWLAERDSGYAEVVDFLDPTLYNPESMISSISKLLGSRPKTPEQWANLALMSLVETTSRQLEKLQKISGRQFSEIRVAGGGSSSEAFCQALADRSGKTVLAGPVEATVLGNLAAQFVTRGVIAPSSVSAVLRRSSELREYRA